MATYIRGARGARLEHRWVARVVAGIAAAAMVCVIVVLTIASVERTARDRRLSRVGVPVRASVVGCTGIASGTGITASAYTCRGAFTLNGRRHIAVLRGSTALHAPGQVVRAVADPEDPSMLATAHSVAHRSAAWTGLVTPGVLLVLLIGAAGVWVLRARRVLKPKAS